MNNYDDRIIIDDEIEVKYEENLNNEQRKAESLSYSNSKVSTNNFFGLILSKKYLALTLSTLSIIMLVFMKFLIICGVRSFAFLGIWFFLCGSCCLISFVLNILNFAKNKKIDFNVSSIISFISLILLFLI